MSELGDASGRSDWAPDLSRRLAYFSLLGGASRLIPVPWIDDWAVDYVRRRMFATLLAAAGLSASQSQIRLLTGGQLPPWYKRGCLSLLALPIKAVAYVLGSLFRKILYVFAAKSAADNAVRVFCEGHLLGYLARTRWLTQARLVDEPFLLWVHWAITTSLHASDPRFLRTAMRRVFKKNREELSQAAADLKRVRRESRTDEAPPDEVPPLPEQPSALTRAADAVLGVFASDPQFLRQLEEEIEARLPNSRKTREDRLTS